MTGTNHALSGALIGSVLPLPLAIPAAFVSHFVIDALPHYGIEEDVKAKSQYWKSVMYGDTSLAILIAVLAAVFRKWNMEIAGWVAFSPDLVWIYAYLKHNKNPVIQADNAFSHFHRKIQNERPNGLIFELLLIFTFTIAFAVQVHK
jgi:hypothetical protein